MGMIVLLVTGASCLLGGVLGDQGYPQAHNYPTQEVTAPLGGYPVEGAETGLSAGGYYENYPTTAGGQYDYSLASYGQDRVGELFTFPMVITAFFSAVLGGLLAPLVVGVAARMSDIELPALPEFSDFEGIEFPVKKLTSSKKKKTKTKTKNKNKGRQFEDAIVNLVSNGFQRLLQN